MRPVHPHTTPDQVLQLLSRLEPDLVVALVPGTGDRCHLAVRPLPADPRCAGAGLFGMEVPQGTALVGATFVGRTDQDGPDAARRRVDVLVTADGAVRSAVRSPHGDAVTTTGAATGVVVDALHRTIGLPSPGGPPPLEHLVAAMWLHELLRLTVHGSPLDWRTAAGLHPAAAPGHTLPPSVESLAAGTVALAAAASWERLRRAAAIGRMAAPELDADEAAWMDATLFGRWMLESFRPPEEAVRLLRDRGPGPVAELVGEVVRRLPSAAA